MLKQLLSATKVIVLALVLSFGLSYAIAAWTPPTLPPPGANTDAPINIGATPQTKVGGDICTTVSGTTKCVQDAGGADNLGNHTATQALNMASNNISNAGSVTTNTLRVVTGAAASRVLTSDASGNATWQAPAVGAGDNLGNHTATQPLVMGANNITATGADVTHGTMTIQGAKAGWAGINFRDAAGTTNYATLMMNGATSGFYNNAHNAWRWYVNDTGSSVQAGTVTAADVYTSTGGYNLSNTTPHGKQRFTANGTWTAPAGVTKVWVTMTGGGGGGGGACSTQGGAGGAGGTKTSEAFTVTPGATYTVNIGTAGTAGAQCNCNAVANGGNGGAASFGTLSVLGGTGGKGGAQGGAPGTDGPRSGMGGAIYGDTYGLRGVGEAAYCIGVATAGTTGFVFVEW